MQVTIGNKIGSYDNNRQVPYLEMLVTGDKHTLSVRKYPKTISVQMWKNSDKSGTKVSLKLPHDKFDFISHVADIMDNFETDLDVYTYSLLEKRWEDATKGLSF